MLTPETITSAANPLLKDVRRAVARGSLTDEGWCIAETLHLLEEALRGPCEIKAVLAAEGERAAGRSSRETSRRHKGGFSAGRTFRRNRRHGEPARV